MGNVVYMNYKEFSQLPGRGFKSGGKGAGSCPQSPMTDNKRHFTESLLLGRNNSIFFTKNKELRKCVYVGILK